MAPRRVVPVALLSLLYLLIRDAQAFELGGTPAPPPSPKVASTASSSRRDFMKQVVLSASVASGMGMGAARVEAAQNIRMQLPPEDNPTVLEDMPALKGLGYGKPRAQYADFSKLPSGVQFKDISQGSGASPSEGDRVAVSWEGYTIGFYGRPFEMQSSVKGSAFAQETDLFRWKVGSGKAIPALDEAVRSMKEGGIRQIIVPPNMGYPSDDPKHELVGPKPSTFSGERALDFVLENSGIIDKTLLINIKLKRVDKPGQRGYKG